MSTGERRLPTAVLALVVPVIAGMVAAVILLGTSDDSPAGAGRGGITIRNFEYEPVTLTVDAGSSIVVTNADDAEHTLTSDEEGQFDTDTLGDGESATITVDAPGRYAYYCAIHDYMQGTLVVKQ